jgi:dynein light chain LC8-type
MSERKAVIKYADMSEEMQRDAVELGILAYEKYVMCKVSISVKISVITSYNTGSFQDMATFIKKEFDNKYGQPWHCIVGRNFAWEGTAEIQKSVYFYIGQFGFLLYKF